MRAPGRGYTLGALLTYVTHLACTGCGRFDSPGAWEYACRKCGGIREVAYDYDAVAEDLRPEHLATDSRRDLRRYLPLLPVPSDARTTPLTIGPSPIVDAPRLARALGVSRALIKDDGRLPTSSLKDRSSFVGTARALRQGHRVIAGASTGNAAASLAGLGASLGLDVVVFVPASSPSAKLAQAMAYGARVLRVDGDLGTAHALCVEASARYGWYDCSPATNPFLIEGKKTCGHEIAEQLQDAELPDWVVMSAGDGCSLAGTWKGLWEMRRIGHLERLPRMLAVQAAGAAPLARAFDAGTEHVERVEARTVADAIGIDLPRNPLKVLRAVRMSAGAFVRVSDPDLLSWVPRLAQLSGVFGEPAAAAAVAGVATARAAGIIAREETVLCVAAGHGLKDMERSPPAMPMPDPVAPSVEAIAERLGRP